MAGYDQILLTAQPYLGLNWRGCEIAGSGTGKVHDRKMHFSIDLTLLANSFEASAGRRLNKTNSTSVIGA